MPFKETVLVTGATGFVGSHLVRRLLCEGYSVHILKRKTSNISRIRNDMKYINSYDVDLLNKTRLNRIVSKINPVFILHLATKSIYNGKDFKSFKEVVDNYSMTLNLLESTRHLNYTKFINTGSSSEYGIKSNPMSEDDSCNPNSFYALSKLISTLLVSLENYKYGKPTMTLRLFTPWGFDSDKKRFMSYVVDCMEKGKKVRVKNPNTTRDFIHIDKVIDYYMKAMSDKVKAIGQVYNVGSGKETKMKEVPRFINKWVADMKKTLSEL